LRNHEHPDETAKSLLNNKLQYFAIAQLIEEVDGATMFGWQKKILLMLKIKTAEINSKCLKGNLIP